LTNRKLDAKMLIAAWRSAQKTK